MTQKKGAKYYSRFVDKRGDKHAQDSRGTVRMYHSPNFGQLSGVCLCRFLCENSVSGLPVSALHAMCENVIRSQLRLLVISTLGHFK